MCIISKCAIKTKNCRTRVLDSDENSSYSVFGLAVRVLELGPNSSAQARNSSARVRNSRTQVLKPEPGTRLLELEIEAKTRVFEPDLKLEYPSHFQSCEQRKKRINTHNLNTHKYSRKVTHLSRVL